MTHTHILRNMKILCCIITGLFGRIFYFWQWWIQFGKPSSLRNVLWIISGQGVHNFDRGNFLLRIGYNFITIKMIHILDKKTGVSRPVPIYLNIKKQEIINHKIEFSHNTIIHENLSQPWAVKFEMNLEIHAWLVFKWKKRSEVKGDSQTSFGQIHFIIINTFCPI